MNSNNGKYFFIPHWLLQENSQTIHAYIYILNEINNNGGEFETSYRNLTKKLNLSLQNVRTIMNTLTQQSTYNITQQSTHEKTLLSIDFIGVSIDFKKPNNTQATSRQSIKQPLEERKKNFIDDLKKFAEQYDKDLLNDFYRYWGETDPKEQKMRFEFQKTWNLNLRLITWHKNAIKNFNKIQSAKPQEAKIGRTTMETIKKNAEYNGKY